MARHEVRRSQKLMDRTTKRPAVEFRHEKRLSMKNSSNHTHNPDKPQMPGEVERDNNAVRGNDSSKRQHQAESTAQKTAHEQTVKNRK